MNVPNKLQVLQLYRSFIRYGEQLKLTDKTFFLKRIRSEFRKKKLLSEPAEISKAFEGKYSSLTRGYSEKDMALKLTRIFEVFMTRRVNSTVLRYKQTFDHSKVPVLNPEDLEEEYVRGSGPGGQAVNKTSNAVLLRHKPSGLIVKCHQTRSLARNRELAREILIQKLDNLINGDLSIDAQQKRVLEKKSRDSSRRSEKLNELKEQWKQREGIE